MILGEMILECCVKRDACAPLSDPLEAGFICLSELAGIGECSVQDSDARFG